MTSTTDLRPVANIAYETATCTRCSGSGRMPYSVKNGVCFGCAGKGVKMTAKGRKAHAAVEAWALANLTVAASALKPGDKIRDHLGSTRTVVEVTTRLGKGNGISREGVEGTERFVETWALGSTEVVTQKVTFGGAAHRPMRRVWTRESLTAVAATVAHLKGAIITYADETA